jgi:uncharacterized membrane protein YqjE
VRLLWSLPKAAPVLLRHVAAYVELASLDLASAKRELQAELAAAALVGICIIFALLLGCILVIAWTWDTPQRVAAIAWMAAGFLAAATVAALYRSKVVQQKSELLATVRQQWLEDRVLLERILSDED